MTAGKCLADFRYEPGQVDSVREFLKRTRSELRMLRKVFVYRDRMQVFNGEASAILPKVLDDLDAIDFFYYASDHAHQNMMSAYGEAKRKLRQGGVVVAVDVGWNASLWDFADRHGAPSYTFKGVVGVGFF